MRSACQNIIMQAIPVHASRFQNAPFLILGLVTESRAQRIRTLPHRNIYARHILYAVAFLDVRMLVSPYDGRLCMWSGVARQSSPDLALKEVLCTSLRRTVGLQGRPPPRLITGEQLAASSRLGLVENQLADECMRMVSIRFYSYN